MNARPILSTVVLMILATAAIARSKVEYNVDGYLNDDLTEEGQPGWMDKLIEKAKAASKAKRGNFGDMSADTELEGTVDGYLNDDLTQEGQPGWMDKLMEEAKAVQKGKRDPEFFQDPEDNVNLGQTMAPIEDQVESLEPKEKRADDEAPDGVITELSEELSKLGGKGEGAKSGLAKIKEKWSMFSSADRKALTGALQNSITNIQTMVNFADDPLEGIKAAMSTIADFAALTGPHGVIVSEVLTFVSGFLGIFGTEEEKSVGEIVREQIDEALAKYKDESLKEEAAGIAHLFDTSKFYVDALSQTSTTLTVDQAHMLAINVPLYNGVEFLGKLMNIIEKKIAENNREGGLKILAYIELYCKLAAMKDVIITETAALLPNELAPNRQALLYTLQELRNKQKSKLKFLFETDVRNNIMPYWDPEDYPATDFYLLEVLKVPNYKRGPLSGVYCIAPAIEGQDVKTWDWIREDSRLMPGGKPYITLGNPGCIWKLVPHGADLYTIKNTFQCPGYDWCDSYVVFEEIHSTLLVSQKVQTRLQLDTKPMLWQMDGSQQRRIRTKYTCGSTDKWCDQQVTIQADIRRVATFGLTSENVGYIWDITK